jgi:hypothetical protein
MERQASGFTSPLKYPRCSSREFEDMLQCNVLDTYVFGVVLDAASLT